MATTDWKVHITSRSFRLASGLVLFVYLSSHLINHAIGLIRLRAAETVLAVAKSIWYSAPGTIVLYGAAATHVALALRTFYLRQHWRLPLLLIGHAVATRVAFATLGAEPRYASVVQSLLSAGTEGWQLALLAPGWVHGCLGLWLTVARHKPSRAMRFGFFALMVLLPLLAAAGFLSMRAEVAAQAMPTIAGAAGSGAGAALEWWRKALTASYLLAVAGALLAGITTRAIVNARRC